MTTLVTGGRGFIGKQLVKQLLDSGTKVVSYNRDFSVDERENVTAVQGELFDIPRLTQTIRDHDISCIIHTAGQSHPGVSVDLPMTTFAANMDGTLSVFEAARMTGVTRIINFSSECCYGNLDESIVVGESTKPTPTTPYGVTKVAGELLGNVYNTNYGMSIASLRITEVYGPGLWMPSLLCDMLRSAIAGRRFVLEEGADHLFQFVYVDDVARAALLASRSDTLKQATYNVSGGRQIKLGDAAHAVRELFPQAQIEIGAGYIRGWDRMGRFDISAAHRDFNYMPDWDFEAGLAATVDWLAQVPAS